jgi:tetratricopeptide (TPR) repeat protein
LTYRASGQAEAAKKDADQSKIIADYRKALTAMDDYLRTHSINEAKKPWDTPDPLDFQPHAILITRAETKTALGDEQSSTAMYEDAIKDSDTYLRLEHIGASEKAQGYYTRGVALRMLNRLDEAVADFTNAIEQSKQSVQPGYPEASLRRGIIFFRQGQYDLAIDDFEDAAYASPFQSDPRAMLWRGLAYAKNGDLNEATRSYTKAIMTYNEFVPAYMNRGLAHMKTGRYADAYADFNNVVRLDGDNAEAKMYRDAAKRNHEQSLGLTSN